MKNTAPKPVTSPKSRNMSDAFPIQIPDRLPVRIAPCPIVEAVFEARFVSPQPWATMPGLLFAQIREKYPEQKTLSVAQMPEELRRQEPALLHLPLIQFLSDTFLIQLGPRVVSLVTKPNTYPGWSAIERELKWLLERLKAAGFVGETERLSARYIDFFGGDVFTALRLGLQINDHWAQRFIGNHVTPPCHLFRTNSLAEKPRPFLVFCAAPQHSLQFDSRGADTSS